MKANLNAVSLMSMMVLLATAAPMVHAALGEPAASVQTDQSELMGRLNTSAESPGAGVSVQEITTPAGTLVREYVSANGIVFAVSWKGPVPPDLSTLLGSYFADYQRAAAGAKTSASLHHSIIRTTNLVVETGGHMRALWGRAFVPALIPAGIDETVIR